MPIDDLPTSWRPPLRRVRDGLMSDAGVMIILGAAITIRGLSYFMPGAHVFVHPLDAALPTWVTATVWTAVGVALLVASRWHCSPVGRATLTLSVAGLGLWGSLFVFSPWAALPQRGIVYLALAAVAIWAVWRGRRGEIRITEKGPHGRGH